ncbi:ankyrin repeat domain-containing protein 13C-like [Oppia nitens]|uniref:ankyrin repeat domain-containing protein 13C-like n=1 Tax=Oppia nitens TaxID=1686743 RepID=UPI0023DA6188|nr:ankyrin repeat domain-containing protein 13C-like [Oppia nitens]
MSVCDVKHRTPAATTTTTAAVAAEDTAKHWPTKQSTAAAVVVKNNNNNKKKELIANNKTNNSADDEEEDEDNEDDDEEEEDDAKDIADRYALHAAVFDGDLRRIAQLVRRYDVQLKDPHGNTPLHLAVMLGHRDVIQLLLAHSAPVKCKNIQGWSPLAEAISYGDRQTITSLLRKLKRQSRDQMDCRRPDLIRALNKMQNFRLELKWDFQSWVPLVSRVLPSDVCRIHKKGSSIRLDTTLVDFSDMRWERGDVSFLFSGMAKPSESLVVVDNKLRCYQRVRYEESDGEIDDEVDMLMSSDIVAAQMSTKAIQFSRAQSGWLWREDRSERVGSFMADFYSISGLYLESRKRREHLSDEDLQKNKAIIESLTKGGAAAAATGVVAAANNGQAAIGGGDGGGGGNDNLTIEPTLAATATTTAAVQRRRSLTPPPTTSVTWDEYIRAAPGQHRPLGRQPVCKESVKAFKATLAMSQDFPMTVDSLLNVLEVMAPFKHFHKLRQFVVMKLPPGFPVKIDIPILPTVTARITFLLFELDDNIPDSLFEIPVDYREDCNRFPDL